MEELAHVDLDKELFEIVDEAARQNIAALQEGQKELRELCEPDLILSNAITTTTENTMPNSYDGRLLIEEIGGVCEQVATTGAQLFDGLLEQGTYDADLNKKDSEYRVRSANNIAVTPNEVYTFSSNIAKDVAIYGLDANGKKVAIISSMTSMPMMFTVSNDISYIAIVLRISDTTAITPSMVSDLMLNKGTEALPWEPYTGGQRAPSPEFPQEIKKTVVSEVRTQGRNFLKNEHERLTTNNGLTFITNDDGTITINGTATANTNYNLGGYENPRVSGLYQNLVQIGGTFNGEVKHMAFTKTWGDGSSFPINTPKLLKENLVYMYFRMAITAGTVCNNLVVGFMICEDLESSHLYEPYTESVITLSQPIELYGIGDVQDVIEDGKVKQRFNKVIINSDNKIVTLEPSVLTNTTRFRLITKKELGVNLGGLSTHFAYKNSYNDDSAHWYVYDSYLYFFMPNGIATSIVELNAWLDEGNTLEFVYKIKEEAEELPIADQIALNNLQTFDGTTYVDFDSEVKPTFTGEYGTSRVGGCSLEAMLEAEKNEMELDEHISKNSEGIATTTETTIQGSYAGNLLVEEIGGVCEQVTTTGKQLLSIPNQEKTIEGLSVSVKNGAITLQGTATSNNALYILGAYESTEMILMLAQGTYTLSDGIALRLYNGTTWTTVTGTFTITQPMTVTGVRIKASLESGKTYNETIYPMLNTGVSLLPFEPYTGGTVAPNPNYPQEIKATTISEIKTQGKNFLKNTASTTVVNGVTFTVNDDGSISVKGTATANADFILKGSTNKNGSIIFNGGTRLVGCPSGGSSSTYFLRASDNVDYAYTDFGQGVNIATDVRQVYIRVLSGVTVNTTFKPMVTIDSDATYDDYAPHTESVANLKFPIELYGVGEKYDVLECDKARRRFTRVVFDGSSDEQWVTSSLKTGRYYVEGVTNSKLLGAAICTHSKHSNGATTELMNHSYFSESITDRFIINTSFATLDEWKAHLADKPMTLIYELAEEVVEELFAADKIALNNLQTYDGITYVKTDSEVPSTFRGKYAINDTGAKALQAYSKGMVNEGVIQEKTSGDVNILMEHGLMFYYYKIGYMVVLQVSGTLDYGISEENKVKMFNSVMPEGYRPFSTVHAGSMSITSKDSSGNRLTAMYDLGIGESGAIQVQVELKDAEGKSITASASSGMPFNMSISYISMDV